MIKFKKLIASALTSVMALSLVGCGINSYTSENGAYNNGYGGSYDSMFDVVGTNSMGAGFFNDSTSKVEYVESNTVAPMTPEIDTHQDTNNTNTSQKFITTYRLTIETKKYDTSMREIKSSIEELGGYIESEDTYDYGKRRTELVLRIPAEKAKEWIENANEFGTTTSLSQTTTDVTLQYVDIEAKLESLEEQRKAYLAILENATTVDEVLSVQSYLSDIIYQIESSERQMRTLESKINYTTINLNVYEVEVETSVNPSFFGEIVEEFVDSIRDIIAFAKSTIIFIIGRSPVLVIWLFIIFFIFKTTKKFRINLKEKRKIKKENKKKMEDEIKRLKDSYKDN